MSIYRRHEVFPEWEPVPYTLTGEAADVQELGFFERAQKPIVWTGVPLQAFPDEGIFGHDRQWFLSRDIAYWATHDGEDLVLVSLPWHGFPDPPEWGLHSRPKGSRGVEWAAWGHVPNLQTDWVVARG